MPKLDQFIFAKIHVIFVQDYENVTSYFTRKLLQLLISRFLNKGRIYHGISEGFLFPSCVDQSVSISPKHLTPREVFLFLN